MAQYRVLGTNHTGDSACLLVTDGVRRFNLLLPVAADKPLTREQVLEAAAVAMRKEQAELALYAVADAMRDEWIEL